MNCAAVEWALAQKAPSSSAKLVLIAIASRIEDGVLQASQAELGRIVQLHERSVRAALKLLEAASLIKRTPNPGKGEGRMADTISLRQPEGQAEEQQQEDFAAGKMEQPENGSAATGKSSRTNRKNIPRQPEPFAAEQPEFIAVEVVDNRPAPCIGTGARAQTQPSNTTISELNPDGVESSGESGARAITMPGAGPLNADWTPSAADRAFASERGYLNGSCDELFGQFLDHCETKGPRISTSWRAEWRKWVRNQVKYDAQRQQRQPSRDSQPATSYVRRKRDPIFDDLLRDEADDQPIDYGRVESYPVE